MQTLGAVLGVFLFLIFGLVGPIILFLAYRYSRSRFAIMIWGVMATVIMVLQCLLVIWLAGIGSATNGGQAAYGVAVFAACFFGICLLLYFVGASNKLTK